MVKKMEEYLSKKALDDLKEKYFDQYGTELQYFRELPNEIQIRIYFEYWFLLKKLIKEKFTMDEIMKERDSVGKTRKTLMISRLSTHISSNGCISIFSPFDENGMYDDNSKFDVDFNYFNKANLTYKVGKFTTEEIIQTIKNLEENRETVDRMYALVLILKDHLIKK